MDAEVEGATARDNLGWRIATQRMIAAHKQWKAIESKYFSALKKENADWRGIMATKEERHISYLATLQIALEEYKEVEILTRKYAKRLKYLRDTINGLCGLTDSDSLTIVHEKSLFLSTPEMREATKRMIKHG